MSFIVAEIGINWEGDLKIAEEMMKKAKEAGCDAVKFQSFNKELVEGHPEAERLIKSSITETNIKKITELSENVGIEWFCTPMFPEAVKMLEPYVKRYKIRVKDGKPLFEKSISELLKQVLNTGKEVIISCEEDPHTTQVYENKNIKWLYCIPKYPCKLADINFEKIKNFDGYSNHCPDIIAPITSIILGGEIVEIHVTLDKLENHIDNPVSFDFNELEKLVQLIRNSEEIKK